MRRFTSVLALMMVLAFAGTSFADLTLTIERQSDPAPGLQSYWLVLHGGQQYEKFHGFNFTGIHQANNIYGPFVVPTVYLNESEEEGGVALDTHYLFPGTDNLEIGVGETNTKTGSPAAGTPPLTYGIGDFTGGTVGLKNPLVDNGSGVPFLQVVARAGTCFFTIEGPEGPEGPCHPIGGWVIADGNPAEWVEYIVPEPSTLVMLALGLLSLVIVRFCRE